MLDERKSAILRAIVQEYITTAQPVGSTLIANAPGVQVSSATVRNEMAVLEQEGYVAQPHTSAGRIPTDKGYRFFVDHVAQPGHLDDASTRRVGEFFDTAHGRIEELLHQTTNLLAQMTSHAAVVVGPSAERARVRSIQLVGLSAAPRHRRRGDVQRLGRRRDVRASGRHVRRPVWPWRPSTCSTISSGESLDPGTTVSTSGDAADRSALRAAPWTALQPSADEPVFVGGTASMAQAFDAVDTVRSVLRTLEQQYVLVVAGARHPRPRSVRGDRHRARRRAAGRPARWSSRRWWSTASRSAPSACSARRA